MAKRRLTFDRRVLLLALLTGLPGSLVALILLWVGDYQSQTQWTLTLLITLLWIGCAYGLL
ncbi:MAG TPA: PAS domain-containing sensor histidine kinase, partial [Verrucomicrobiae bacterium]|nr:PAS domain-containing sensor histidine kinase [Verrucomicrobiae bacterium]